MILAGYGELVPVICSKQYPCGYRWWKIADQKRYKKILSLSLRFYFHLTVLFYFVLYPVCLIIFPGVIAFVTHQVPR